MNSLIYKFIKLNHKGAFQNVDDVCVDDPRICTEDGKRPLFKMYGEFYTALEFEITSDGKMRVYKFYKTSSLIGNGIPVKLVRIADL